MKNLSLFRITHYTGIILFFSFLFYFLYRIDTSLVYYWQQSIPYCFIEHLLYPGGISELLSMRFTELLANSFLGIAAGLGLYLLILISYNAVFKNERSRFDLSYLFMAGLIPCALLFAYYDFPVRLLVNFVIGLILALFHTQFIPEKPVNRILFQLLSGALIYLLTGTTGLLILIQLLIIQIILSKKYHQWPWILPIFFLPVLYLPFDSASTLKTAYLGSFSTSIQYHIPLIFYLNLFFPLILFLLYSGIRILSSRASQKMKELLGFTGKFLVLLTFILSYVYLLQETENERLTLKIEKAGFQDEWESVLQLGDEIKSQNNVALSFINRALYNKGLLLEQLFFYPQNFGKKGIFLEGQLSSRVSIVMSDFYYDMGYVNESRHWANEAYMLYNRHPLVLKRLIITYAASGKTEMALKYLRILSKSGLDKQWAEMIGEKILNSEIRQMDEVQNFILNNPETDFFATTIIPLDKINKFFICNPGNHMAFEFMIAGLLLDKNITEAVRNIPNFKRFGYENLPRAMEEAALVYMSKKSPQEYNLSGYNISQNTLNKFTEFYRTVSTGKSRADAQKKAAVYKNTYWYYLNFIGPGGIQN